MEFAAAMAEEGYALFRVTALGLFEANLTAIRLSRLRVTWAAERGTRIAFVAPRPGYGRVLIPLTGRTATICGGLPISPGHIVAQPDDCPFHERLDGPCRWLGIVFPVRLVERYGRALMGLDFAVPPTANLLRAPRTALKRLIELGMHAVHRAETHSGIAARSEAARGLELELIHALVDCLIAGRVRRVLVAAGRDADVMRRFEAALDNGPQREPPIARVAELLGVSDRTLRACCERHLRLGPRQYAVLGRMQLVRHDLRASGASAGSVAKIARSHGFAEPGRFAMYYRTLFGELPSATLRSRQT